MLETDDATHLVVGYNQEQAYRLMIDGDGTGLKHIFGKYAIDRHDPKLGSYLEVTTPKGIRRVLYKGGGKSNSVGSVTGLSLGSVVFLEINLLNMQMINECFRRTFAAKNRFHMADLNPPAPHHPVIKDVFEVQDTKWTHFTPNDNPILTDKRKKELFDTLSKSPYLLQRDWYGQRVMPEGVIYSMFDVNRHVKPTLMGKPIEMFFVADGGQMDATSCSCNIVTLHEGQYILNRVANYYHSGRDTGQVKAMSQYAREIKQFIEWCKNKYQMQVSELFVDPACRSLREELNLIGVYNSKADNNGKDVKGSSKGMEVGIERVQSLMTDDKLFLVECDEYGHYDFLKNIGMYVRLDNGKPIDKYNDNLDELRYSVNYFAKRYGLV